MSILFKAFRSGIGTALWMAVLSGANFYNAFAGPLSIKDSPLFLNDNSAPLNMLVVGRDHRMYYEAYNDASDLNNDNIIDTKYKPTQIDYYGYFDSFKCYTYAGGVFSPSNVTANKQCTGKWSGDWLNYVTMSRIDALRKVLYGGLRSTDTTTDTVLQRSFIPQDAHSWGKEYTSIAEDGYDIAKYTPYGQPNANRHHLFANTTPAGDTAESGNTNAAINGVALPKLHVLENRQNRIWEWVSKEQPVAGNRIDNSKWSGGAQDAVTPTPYIVRVKVCVSGLEETNCKTYGSTKKPTGLIQDYGENDTMLFGLMSGSYAKPHDGGVLRKAVSSVKPEVNLATGQFYYNQNPPGIISTMDRFRVTSFGTDFKYTCGWITTNPDDAGSCSMWGNPTAEMMYETLRYFAGKGAPTTDYIASTDAEETSLGLKRATWSDPYATAPRCAKPFETVISDVYPSFDTDKLPGSNFSGWSGNGAVAGFNAKSEADNIWSKEMGGSGSYFIGQSGGVNDGTPKPKTVTSFGDIRGIAPEGPTRQGGYYASSVSYFGHEHDLNNVSGDQKMQTFAVALASPLPKIEIPTAGGKKVTLVPFAKSVGGDGWGINVNGSFQPTNQIVDFYVESVAADGSSGKFRVNFEDVEQGADHDMDAIALYEYSISGGIVTVKVTSEYAAGSIIQHMGYVISGTTADGTYLVVRDVDTAAASDPNYFLDTPNIATELPFISTRTFTPGSSTGASLLNDPLWYAAKWGGFKDSNGNNYPDGPAEWDEDGDGDPDNYFLVTNALTLKDQLSKAFNDILNRAGSASSASVNSGSISSDTLIFQAKFNSQFWGGELLAFPISLGGVIGSQIWNAKEPTTMPAPANRKIFTPTSSTSSNIYNTAMPFKYASIAADATRRSQLQETSAAEGATKVDFLRGVRTLERTTSGAGIYRKRESALGDIVSSSPIFVGTPSFRYSDSLESAPYSAFKTAKANRMKMVYVGANDGMLHGFSAADGKEQFAFIPSSVFPALHKLANPAYSHLYYVDGTPTVIDAFYGGAWHTALVSGLNKGGQGVFALDVTDPGSITDSGSAFMWEYTDKADADLGYTFSRPAIVRLKNGVWAAVFGNGYNNTVNVDSAGNTDSNVSATGNAALYIVNLQTGALIRKISTGVGTAQDPLSLGRPNGLATPAMVDLDNDDVIDFAYAGDLFGNLWKFDLTSNDANAWGVAYSQPLFTAIGPDLQRQPITERPVVARGPNGSGLVILFGTGKFLEPDDRDPSKLKKQSFYGIVDRNSGVALTDVIGSGRSKLTAQTILAEPVVGTLKTRVTSNNPVDYTTKKGWYLDLVSPSGFEGEMQVSDPLYRNGRVIFTTLIPDSDVCAYGGRSWLMEMDALSGSRLPYSPYDLNDDGVFDVKDYVEITLADGTKAKVAVSGAQLSDGIASRPSILTSITPGSGPGEPNPNPTDPYEDVPLECKEFKFMPDSSGTLKRMAENCGPGVIGRQSWRQIR